MDPHWRSAPWALVHVRHGVGGSSVEPNPAAIEWSRRLALRDNVWPGLAATAAALVDGAAFDAPLPGLDHAVRIVRREGGSGGFMLHLVAWAERRRGRDGAPPLAVVCVEDNAVNMMLLRELLALRPQVQMHCAIDGEAGVAVALRVKPQVMLLDLQLPGIGGIEVMQRVRERLGGGCAYVAVTAFARPEQAAAALAAGIDRYWTKPLDFKRFLAGIDELIAARGLPVA